MKIYFLHKSFPSQFGQIEEMLQERGHECTHFCERTGATERMIDSHGFDSWYGYKAQRGIQIVEFPPLRKDRCEWYNMGAVYQELLKGWDPPDIIVAHCPFAPTMGLRDWFVDKGTKIVSYIEWWHNAEELRPDLWINKGIHTNYWREVKNACIERELWLADAVICPTKNQAASFPKRLRNKLAVQHDGIGVDYWQPFNNEDWRTRGIDTLEQAREDLGFKPDAKVISYVSPSFESARGFDVFMFAAIRALLEHDNLEIALVGGSRKFVYGDDYYATRHNKKYMPPPEHLKLRDKNGDPVPWEFGDWVRDECDRQLDSMGIARDTIDDPENPAFIDPEKNPRTALIWSRFKRVDIIDPDELIKVWTVSDLHVYLTANYICSWSLLNAMSCSTPCLVSDTEPVREFVTENKNGWHCKFPDVDDLVRKAGEIIKMPREKLADHGRIARERVVRDYSLSRTVDSYEALFNELKSGSTSP